MPYRSNLDALRTREDELARELAEVEAIAARKESIERDLADVRRAMHVARVRPLHMLRAPRIPLPCDVPWDSMTGDSAVRFCGKCEKKVYNLSAITEPEAVALLEQDGVQCVRYYQRPDGTVLTSDCPLGARTSRRRRARGAVTAVVVGITGAAAAAGMTTTTGARERIATLSVDHLIDSGNTGQYVRADGTLVHGSITTTDGVLRFVLESRGVTVPVRYQGRVLPDNFQDIEGITLTVLVEGALSEDGVFLAQHVAAKSPSGAYYGAHRR